MDTPKLGGCNISLNFVLESYGENKKQKTSDGEYLKGNKRILGFNKAYRAELRGFDSGVGGVLAEETGGRREKVTSTAEAYSEEVMLCD
jgi:hypothetical protein